MIAVTGALVGATEKAAQLIATLEKILDEARQSASKFTIKPKVYFEEWDDPMMCSIRWAMELIELAGGTDCFPELSNCHSAKDRIVTSQQVVERQPDIIIGSWCGKKFQPEQVMSREGWADLSAVKHGFVREIKSADILQPGPSLITHGLKQIQAIIQEWQRFQAELV
jgi:iron complex transport system substrate-binding protein